MTGAIEPGWYPDPEGRGQRWWDGQAWGPRAPQPSAFAPSFPHYVGDQIPTVHKLVERARKGEQIWVDDEELAAIIDVISDACEYMRDNCYDEDDTFPEDVMACQVLGDGGIAWNCYRNSAWTHNAAQGGRCPSCGKETTAPPCDALSDWHDRTSLWWHWQQEEVSDDRSA